jgi:putative hemolysin
MRVQQDCHILLVVGWEGELMSGRRQLNTSRRLSVRLAQDEADLEAVQRLRWRVFF